MRHSSTFAQLIQVFPRFFPESTLDFPVWSRVNSGFSRFVQGQLRIFPFGPGSIQDFPVWSRVNSRLSRFVQDQFYSASGVLQWLWWEREVAGSK